MSRRVIRVSELSEQALKDIRAAKPSERSKALDHLMDEKP